MMQPGFLNLPLREEFDPPLPPPDPDRPPLRRADRRPTRGRIPAEPEETSVTDPTPDPKLSTMPGVKEALAEAVAGLVAGGLPAVWADGFRNALAEMADGLLAIAAANLERQLATAAQRIYEMEAVENDRHARTLDALPGQQAAASWHRAMAARFRAKAKVVPGA